MTDPIDRKIHELSNELLTLRIHIRRIENEIERLEAERQAQNAESGGHPAKR